MQSATPLPPPPPEAQHARNAVTITNCCVDPEFSVYVGNLDLDTSVHDMEELLYELFLQAGPLSKVHIPFFRDTDRHKGFGFVQFQHTESVSYSLQLMAGIRLFGKVLILGPAVTSSSSASSSSSSSSTTTIPTSTNPFVSAFKCRVAQKEDEAITANPFLNNLTTHVTGGPPPTPATPVCRHHPPPTPPPLRPPHVVPVVSPAVVPTPLMSTVPSSSLPLLPNPPSLGVPRLGVPHPLIPLPPSLPLPLPPPPPTAPTAHLNLPLSTMPSGEPLHCEGVCPPAPHPVLPLPTPPSAQTDMRPLCPSLLPTPPPPPPPTPPPFFPRALPPPLSQPVPTPVSIQQPQSIVSQLPCQPLSGPSFSLDTIISSSTTTDTDITMPAVVSFGTSTLPHEEPNTANSSTPSFVPLNIVEGLRKSDEILSLNLNQTMLQMRSANQNEEEFQHIMSNGLLNEKDGVAEENGLSRNESEIVMESCPMSLNTYISSTQRGQSSPSDSNGTTEYQIIDHNGVHLQTTVVSGITEYQTMDYNCATVVSGPLCEPARSQSGTNGFVSDNHLFTNDDSDGYQGNSGFKSFSIDQITSEMRDSGESGEFHNFNEDSVNDWPNSSHSSPYKNGSFEPCLPYHYQPLLTNTDQDQQICDGKEFTSELSYHSGLSQPSSVAPLRGKVEPFGLPPTKLHRTRLGRRDHPQWLGSQTRDRIHSYHLNKLQNTFDQLKEAFSKKPLPTSLS